MSKEYNEKPTLEQRLDWCEVDSTNKDYIGDPLTYELDPITNAVSFWTDETSLIVQRFGQQLKITTKAKAFFITDEGPEPVPSKWAAHHAKDLEKLKQLVERPCISLAGLATEAGIATEHLRAVIKGRRPLTAKTVSKLKPVIDSLHMGL
jgi:hypothetical protein